MKTATNHGNKIVSISKETYKQKKTETTITWLWRKPQNSKKKNQKENG